MRSLRVLTPTLLLLVLAWTPIVNAQEEPPNVETQVKEALDVLKAVTTREAKEDNLFSMKLAQARATLLQNPELAVPALLELQVTENNDTIRLNGAIVLAEISRTTEKPIEGLYDALARCASDSNPGVSLVGFKGLMTPAVPEAVRLEKLKEFLDPDMPRPVRMTAILQIDQMKFTPAIPLLVSHMQAVLGAYKSQVDGELTRTEAVGAPAPAQTETAYYEEEEEESELERLQREAASGKGRRSSRPGARGPNPGAAQPAQPEMRTYKIDPATLSKRDQEFLIDSMENQPVIVELHRTGLILETLVAQSFPETEFGFSTTPPWQLEESVKKAVKWFQDNRAAVAPNAARTRSTEGMDSAS
jgi:hypothetical protein